MKQLFTFLIAFFVGFAAHALDKTAPSLVFKREIIRLVPPESFVIFSDQQAQDQAVSVAQPVEIETDIRGEQMLRQNNVHRLQTLKKGSGVMMVMRHPLDIPLMNLPVRRPLDILQIDSKGLVVQIFPDVVLAELQQDYFSGKLIKAMLYLHGGTVTKHNIKPGTRVEHATFNPGPKILK